MKAQAPTTTIVASCSRSTSTAVAAVTVVLLGLFLLAAGTPPCGPVVVATASTTTTSTTAASVVNPNNYYESVRQLDKYGNSIQLRFAGEASRQRGRLVVAIALPRGDVVLATPVVAAYAASLHTGGNNNDGENDESVDEAARVTTASSGMGGWPHRDPPLRFTSWGVQRGYQRQRRRQRRQRRNTDDKNDAAETVLAHAPMARGLNPPRLTTSPTTAPMTRVATVTSGLGSDARYVHQHLQILSKDAWDVYGTTDISGPAVLNELQSLYRKFWGYPSSWNWRNNPRNDDDDDNDEWARPLGVTTMIIQQQQYAADPGALSSGANVYVVEPSGIIQHATRIVSPSSRTDAVVSVACIGRNSGDVQSRLVKLLRERVAEQHDSDNPLSVDDVLPIMADAIYDDESSRQLSSPTSTTADVEVGRLGSSSHLYVEILSKSGDIQRKVVPT